MVAPAASAVAAELSAPASGRRWAAGTTAAVFALLFAHPFVLLIDDWLHHAEAGHGLLLAPIAGWLAWRTRRGPAPAPQHRLGVTVLAAAVLLRYGSGLAAEPFTMRLSMVTAAAGLVVYFAGFPRLLRWWLPFALITLSIPLPEVLLNSLALPLQFQASELGAALLDARHVPVRLEGNVISLPGQRLFVTEACSGLRSLTALLSLGVLAGGLWLRSPVSRVLLLASTIPVAVGLNGLRVFLTGFLVFFVDPAMGRGFLHLTQGWLMFLVAFALLGALAVLFAAAEKHWMRPR